MTRVDMTSDITVTPIRHLAEDRFVAEAARVSTLAEVSGLAAISRDNSGLIRRLMEGRHGSPFEHTFFTWRISAPLFVMTEHLRHRIGWNYNGESGRYKTFDPVFYTPPADRGVTQEGRAIEYDIRDGSDDQRTDVAADLEGAAEDAWDRYSYLLNTGIAREVARQVLPTNLMTTYYTSANARSLMYFLGLRGEGTHALWEIQQVAKGYELAFADAMPETFAAFVAQGRGRTVIIADTADIPFGPENGEAIIRTFRAAGYLVVAPGEAVIATPGLYLMKDELGRVFIDERSDRFAVQVLADAANTYLKEHRT